MIQRLGDKAFDRAGLQNARMVKVHELGKKTSFEDIFDANVKKAVTGEEIDGGENCFLDHLMMPWF